ncbi:hypothetical protein A0H81_10223 [Grifola frondosa]|uniref:Uncharacterized protein n=1 Tax=Grifola frondosa TaxID=5627 RepID=A0A1C7LY28_GRIFR|nr:hypothetical protein A0H81_10223 [Grifola frondosa]
MNMTNLALKLVGVSGLPTICLHSLMHVVYALEGMYVAEKLSLSKHLPAQVAEELARSKLLRDLQACLGVEKDVVFLGSPMELI